MVVETWGIMRIGISITCIVMLMRVLSRVIIRVVMEKGVCVFKGLREIKILLLVEVGVFF